MKTSKQVFRRLTPDAQLVLLATFHLENGGVEALYENHQAAAEFGTDGIVEGFTPADGRRFWEALDRAFARSSTLIVRQS